MAVTEEKTPQPTPRKRQAQKKAKQQVVADQSQPENQLFFLTGSSAHGGHRVMSMAANVPDGVVLKTATQWEGGQSEALIFLEGKKVVASGKAGYYKIVRA